MCMVDYADGPWTTLDDVWRTARKEHRCDECGRGIAKGRRYHRSVGIGEDGFMSFKSCPHCKAAGEWLMVMCRGYIMSAVLEDLEEHWDESPELRSLTLGRLIIGMRRKWRDGADPVPDMAAVSQAARRSMRGAA